MSQKQEAVSRFQRIFEDLMERMGGRLNDRKIVEDEFDLVYVHGESGTELRVKFEENSPHQVEVVER